MGGVGRRDTQEVDAMSSQITLRNLKPRLISFSKNKSPARLCRPHDQITSYNLIAYYQIKMDRQKCVQCQRLAVD